MHKTFRGLYQSDLLWRVWLQTALFAAQDLENMTECGDRCVPESGVEVRCAALPAGKPNSQRSIGKQWSHGERERVGKKPKWEVWVKQSVECMEEETGEWWGSKTLVSFLPGAIIFGGFCNKLWHLNVNECLFCRAEKSSNWTSRWRIPLCFVQAHAPCSVFPSKPCAQQEVLCFQLQQQQFAGFDQHH